MKKIILVTGSTGFIGTNLCLNLLNDGHNVIGISKECPKNIISHRYKVIKHDVKNPFDTFNCDEVYHLASYASCSYFEKDPVSIADTILLGTINALNFAKTTGAKFLYASTYGVYSDSNNLEFRSCYDSSKLAMESYVYNFGKQNKIPTKILRIPSVYGPHMRVNENKLITILGLVIISLFGGATPMLLVMKVKTVFAPVLISMTDITVCSV